MKAGSTLNKCHQKKRFISKKCVCFLFTKKIHLAKNCRRYLQCVVCGRSNVFYQFTKKNSPHGTLSNYTSAIKVERANINSCTSIQRFKKLIDATEIAGSLLVICPSGSVNYLNKPLLPRYTIGQLPTNGQVAHGVEKGCAIAKSISVAL